MPAPRPCRNRAGPPARPSDHRSRPTRPRTEPVATTQGPGCMVTSPVQRRRGTAPHSGACRASRPDPGGPVRDDDIPSVPTLTSEFPVVGDDPHIDAPARAVVRRLSTLLGGALADQHGTDLLELVEDVRRQTKEAKSSADPEDALRVQRAPGRPARRAGHRPDPRLHRVLPAGQRRRAGLPGPRGVGEGRGGLLDPPGDL